MERGPGEPKGKKDDPRVWVVVGRDGRELTRFEGSGSKLSLCSSLYGALALGVLGVTIVLSIPIAAWIDNAAGGDPRPIAATILCLAGLSPVFAGVAVWGIARWGRGAYFLWLPVAVPGFVLLGFIPIGRRSGQFRIDLLNQHAGIHSASTFVGSAVAGAALIVLTGWVWFRLLAPRRGQGQHAPPSGAEGIRLPASGIAVVTAAIWVLGGATWVWFAGR